MTHKIYMHAMSEGGFGSESIETEAIFTEAQATAIEGLLRFVADNAHKPYWTTEVQAELVEPSAEEQAAAVFDYSDVPDHQKVEVTARLYERKEDGKMYFIREAKERVPYQSTGFKLEELEALFNHKYAPLVAEVVEV